MTGDGADPGVYGSNGFDEPVIGILVHGGNHFIVRGPMPDRSTAIALARNWSFIQIGQGTRLDLRKWTISSREFREDLEWAILVPGEGQMTAAVATLLAELAERGVSLHDADQKNW